jgi:hypothetical protein
MVQLLDVCVVCKNEMLSFQIAHHQLRPVTPLLRAVCFRERLNSGLRLFRYPCAQVPLVLCVGIGQPARDKQIAGKYLNRVAVLVKCCRSDSNQASVVA